MSSEYIVYWRWRICFSLGLIRFSGEEGEE